MDSQFLIQGKISQFCFIYLRVCIQTRSEWLLRHNVKYILNNGMNIMIDIYASLSTFCTGNSRYRQSTGCTFLNIIYHFICFQYRKISFIARFAVCILTAFYCYWRSKKYFTIKFPWIHLLFMHVMYTMVYKYFAT